MSSIYKYYAWLERRQQKTPRDEDRGAGWYQGRRKVISGFQDMIEADKGRNSEVMDSKDMEFTFRN
jgi:hypothetical protein